MSHAPSAAADNNDISALQGTTTTTTTAPSNTVEAHAAAPITDGMTGTTAATTTKPTSSKGRGKRLTDAQRMQIIARLEDKTAPLTRAECARLYGVSPAAIGKLMKVSATVKKRYSDAGADAGPLRDKRQRGGFSKNMCFEDELFKWICSIRARRIPLLVAHVQQKAKLLAAKHLLHDTFKASNGWYYRFCTRYGLVPGSLHSGGSGSSVRVSDVHTSNGSSAPAAADAASAHTAHQVGPTAADPAIVTVFGTSVDTTDSDAGKQSNDAAATPEAPRTWSSESDTSDQVTALQRTVAQYSPEFVYTLSEARLFYKLLPSPLVPPALATQQHGSDESNAATRMKTSMERALVLVCANGAGTHKVPLLVVGTQRRPSCFRSANSNAMRVGATQYVSQRDVWCDNATFQYWCTRVFAPAVAAHTTQPVLLLLDNPADSLNAFVTSTITTMFLPTRPGGLSASLQFGAAFAHLEPLQHGTIRELKRQYKLALFHDALSVLERSADERHCVAQRARQRPHGATGIACGQLPHVGDAMALLEDAWAAIPQQLLRTGWIRSQLHVVDTTAARDDVSAAAISDDVVVLELCAMLQRVRPAAELPLTLAKELRQWLSADDDSSERMQQELLHDVQRLLQDEANKRRTSEANEQSQLQQSPLASALPATPSLSHHVSTGGFIASLMQSTSLPLQPTALVDTSTGSSSSAAALAMGYAFAHHTHTLATAPVPAQQTIAMHSMHSMQLQHQHSAQVAPQCQQLQHLSRLQQQLQQQQPAAQPPSSQQQVDTADGEQCNAARRALQALTDAQAALDNADVATHFGTDATRAASDVVLRLLRQLRRIDRGKQAATTLEPSVRAYFY